jgi:spermidine synthase
MTFHENSNVSIYLSDLILLETPRSSVQEVSLYSHPELGFVLIINGEVQHISEWSCYYHESLVHLPIAFIPEIKKVLILGGGDLYAANEVLKYPTVM